DAGGDVVDQPIARDAGPTRRLDDDATVVEVHVVRRHVRAQDAVVLEVNTHVVVARDAPADAYATVLRRIRHANSRGGDRVCGGAGGPHSVDEDMRALDDVDGRDAHRIAVRSHEETLQLDARTPLHVDAALDVAEDRQVSDLHVIGCDRDDWTRGTPPVQLGDVRLRRNAARTPNLERL